MRCQALSSIVTDMCNDFIVKKAKYISVFYCYGGQGLQCLQVIVYLPDLLTCFAVIQEQKTRNSKQAGAELGPA